MRIILFIAILFSIVGVSCHDVTVGYLWMESPGYNPDTMVVKAETSLDVTEPTWGTWPNPEYEVMISQGIPPELLESLGIFPTFEGYGGGGEDYDRHKWDQPYVSTSIEGVEGTQQIYATLKDVKPAGEGADKLREALIVWGDGRLQLPLHHGVPAGRYLISLTFSNEGYSKDVDDCFTIIVK